MKKRSALSRNAVWVIALSLAAIVALLFGSLLIGPSNPDALPLTHLKISEVMAENLSAFPDESNDYYAWAEITNYGGLPIDLSRIHLTDDPDRPDRYTFPEEYLAAGDSVVVFLTGNSSESRPYHASFGLKNGKESLYLFADTQTLVDTISLSEAPQDRSYGLMNDTYGWFATASPGERNHGVCAPTLDELKEALFTGVMINEVCTVSRSGDAQFPCDWVELYNVTDAPISLAEYRLTEDPETEGLRFTDTVIAPRSYLLIYCDSNDPAPAGALQAPFSLNRNGDTVYLVTPDGDVADSFDSGKQRYGVTSGRNQSDRNTRVFFNTPTPAAANGTPYSGYTAAPIFSTVGGYLSKNSTVTISVPAQSTVYYTTDGSLPTEQSLRYSAGTAIPLNSTSVIRAAAYRKGYLVSDVVTQTFLIDQQHKLPVVSVSGDPDALFGKNGAWSNPNDNTLQPTVHTEYFTEDGKKELDFDSIFRIAGGWSRENTQKAFSLNLNQTTGNGEISYPLFEDTDVSLFHNVLLRPSGSDWSEGKLRDEFVAQALKNTDGQLIQSARPVALYLNGDYYGLYYLREKRNEDFIASYTDIPAENVQLVQHPALDDYGAQLDPDLQALITYAKTHDLTVAQHYDYVTSQIDTTSLMQYFAYQTFFGNGDFINNITCFRDKHGGKWQWIVFDMDWACTSFYAQRNFLQQLYDGTPYAEYMNYHYPLMTALLKNDTFRTEFLTTYARLLQTTLDKDRLLPILNDLAAEIEAEIPLQYRAFSKPSVKNWEWNVNYIRKFISGREAVIIDQLKTTFSLTDEQWDTLYEEAIKP